MRHRAKRAPTPYCRAEAKSHAGILGNAARRDTSPHHTAATSAAAPVEIAAVDDLRRSVEEVKRTVRKANREIMRTPTPRARGARQRQENVDSPRVSRGVAGRQRRLSVTRGALRLLPQPQEQFLSTRASPRDKTAPVGKITHGFGTIGFSGTCAARNTKALTLLLSTAIRCSFSALRRSWYISFDRFFARCSPHRRSAIDCTRHMSQQDRGRIIQGANSTV